MSIIPFDLSQEASDALIEFKEGKKNWVELTVDNETVQLVASRFDDDQSCLKDHVSTQNASFIALNFKKNEKKSIQLFIFSCPEDVPIRNKMTMSSSKVSFFYVCFYSSY